MKTIIKILLFVLLSWPLSVASQEPSPRPLGRTKHIEDKSDQSNKTTNANQYGTEQRPFVVKTITTPKGKEETDYETYERHEKLTNERRLTWATIWLAVVTTFLAVFTAYLWDATRKLVKSAEETARRQLRAFIFGKGFNHGPNIWNGKIKEYVFSVTWENVGLTPGVDVCNWFNIQTGPADGKDKIIFSASGERRPTVMGPRATAQTSYLTIPLENMMKCWRKEIAILIWSRVEYRDIFDATILHHHEQCASIDFIHDPSSIPPEGHPPYIQFTIHGPQNSTG